MRSEALASLHSLLEQNPFVSIILPALPKELDSGHFLDLV